MEGTMSDYKGFAKNIVENWKSENEKSFSFNSESWSRLSTDLLIFLDSSIHYAEDNINSSGKDKKAIVLAIMQIIFVDIVLNNLPIYFKPFSQLIKFVAVNILFSAIIDFIVSKYKDGIWKKEAKNEV
jgi:hypothetical protein